MNMTTAPVFKFNKRQMLKWIKALRSGEYKQTTGVLNDSTGFCCLGVGCKVLVDSSLLIRDRGFIDGGVASDQEFAPSWLKAVSDDFCTRTGNSLEAMNDGIRLNAQGLTTTMTFDEIADLLEAVYILKVL